MNRAAYRADTALNARIGKTIPNPLFDSLVASFHERDDREQPREIERLKQAIMAQLRQALPITRNARKQLVQHAQRMSRRASFLVGALLVAVAFPLLHHALEARAATRDDAALAAARTASVAWPARFRDQPLTQLAPTLLEQTMASDFPGAVARFSDGRAIIVLREVEAPTRRLLSVGESLRALRYQIGRTALNRDDEGVVWNCFDAHSPQQALHVCERFYNSEAASWPDAASWFWSTQYGGGPWWSVAEIEAIAN